MSRNLQLRLVSLCVGLSLSLFTNADRCLGFEVEKLTIRCDNSQEPRFDDVYIIFVVDDKAVNFSSFQGDGLSRRNPRQMMTGDTFEIDSDTLSKLKFNTTLRIHVMEMDPFSDEVLGRFLIKTDGEVEEERTGQVGLLDWKYKAKWKVKP